MSLRVIFRYVFLKKGAKGMQTYFRARAGALAVVDIARRIVTLAVFLLIAGAPGALAADAPTEVLQGWPVILDRPIVASRVPGYLEAGTADYLVHFKARSVTAAFYDYKGQRTVITFPGAVFFNRLRTNLIVPDSIMSFDDVLDILGRQSSAKGIVPAE